MRVLVIEDDKNLARGLKGHLKDHYMVDLASTGKDGLQKADGNIYDLIILDLGLPDISGVDVCAKIRSSGIQVPTLVLTGEGDVRSKVKALDAGADDYLTKPFSLQELEARMRALLRRSTHDLLPAQLTVGDLVLDPASRKVLRGAQEISLRRKEFDLLQYLMRHPGKALTRDMILDNVWDVGSEVWANVVDVHINYLRKKIDQNQPKTLIRTVHGIGYKIEA